MRLSGSSVCNFDEPNWMNNNCDRSVQLLHVKVEDYCVALESTQDYGLGKWPCGCLNFLHLLRCVQFQYGVDESYTLDVPDGSESNTAYLEVRNSRLC